MIIISDQVCTECGAFSAGNGYCSNYPGHPWNPRPMTPEEQAELAIEEIQPVRKTFPTALFGQCYAAIEPMGPTFKVRIKSAEDSGPIATLSIAPSNPALLGEGEFVAKTYSENATLAPEILASGLFEETGKIVDGFPVWRVVGGWQALGA